MPAFSSVCVQYSIMREAERVLAVEGIVIAGHRGVTSKHPAVTILKAAANEFQKGCTEFGLTPASRQRLDIEIEDPMEGEDLLT